MQAQDNTEMCYWRGNRRTRRKISLLPSKQLIDLQENKLEYTNNKRPSKPSPCTWALQAPATNWLLETLSSLAFPDLAI